MRTWVLTDSYGHNLGQYESIEQAAPVVVEAMIDQYGVEVNRVDFLSPTTEVQGAAYSLTLQDDGQG